MSAWYVLPFGIIFSAVVIRIVEKLAQATKRSPSKQRQSTQEPAVAS